MNQQTNQRQDADDDVQGFRRAATSHDFRLAARLNLSDLGVRVPSLLGAKPGVAVGQS